MACRVVGFCAPLGDVSLLRLFLGELFACRDDGALGMISSKLYFWKGSDSLVLVSVRLPMLIDAWLSSASTNSSNSDRSLPRVGRPSTLPFGSH